MLGAERVLSRIAPPAALPNRAEEGPRIHQTQVDGIQLCLPIGQCHGHAVDHDTYATHAKGRPRAESPDGGPQPLGRIVLVLGEQARYRIEKILQTLFAGRNEFIRFHMAGGQGQWLLLVFGSDRDSQCVQAIRLCRLNEIRHKTKQCGCRQRQPL